MKTITVKGVGTASARPDFVVLSLSLETVDQTYETAMNKAAEKIGELNSSLAKVGFEKESVKTIDFDVRTDYESEKDRNGNYRRVFNGYVVKHRLKVSFDFDTKVLAQVLNAISSCVARPELSVCFTVKDPSAINEALLVSATENAKKKAVILCGAMDSKLGEIVSIDYNWGELDIYSRTRYEVEDDCKCLMAAPMSIDVEPDDIDTSDSVTFVWEIL